MNVRVFDEGQVARAAGNRDVHVVLDTSGLGTMPDTQIAVPRVRIERHEDDLRPLLSSDPRRFWKLDVVADLDRDLAAVGVEDLYPVARGDAPPFALAGRDMQLVLLTDRTIAAEEIRNVVQRSLFDHEV